MATDDSFIGSDKPASGAYVVTTSDTVDLPIACRALYIGGDGNVNLITTRGETTLFSGLTAGTVLPIQATRVKATSTTATLIVAMY